MGSSGNQSNDPNYCGLHSFECDGHDMYIETGIYFKQFSKDKKCKKLQGKIPTALGCFCTSDTTSFRASCSNDSYGMVTEYADSTCGEVDKVTDLRQCKKELKYNAAGFVNVHVYAKMRECVLPNYTITSTAYYSTMESTQSTRSIPNASVYVGPLTTISLLFTILMSLGFQ